MVPSENVYAGQSVLGTDLRANAVVQAWRGFPTSDSVLQTQPELIYWVNKPQTCSD